MQPRGAVARRNRTLRIYAAVLAAGAICLTVYCATRHPFDLSTPKSCLDSFKRAMDGHRWAEAEQCLTDECRAHYAGQLADRRLFDFYSPYGYQTEFGRFVPDWRVGSIEPETQSGTTRAKITSGGLFAGREEAGFWLELRHCPDGMWRVDGPRTNADSYYEMLIPPEARGWGAANERR